MRHFELCTAGVAVLGLGIVGCESQGEADERMETVPAALRAPGETGGSNATAPVTWQTGDTRGDRLNADNDTAIDAAPRDGGTDEGDTGNTR